MVNTEIRLFLFFAAKDGEAGVTKAEAREGVGVRGAKRGCE